ncbi:MAG TPA: polymer-forming cytoskeletal protein [Bryobacteraceae bacterium]|nr:polymer-forming cytoskeletal protein [Bryobacteraceae bacterium]
MLPTPTSQAVLGRQVTVKGEIRSREPLTIDGEVDGTIDVSGHRLIISAGGKVRANVKATEIDVAGSLEGNVDGANTICIRAGAHFLGDIRAHGIVIEDGGFIKGKVDLSQPSNAAKAG